MKPYPFTSTRFDLDRYLDQQLAKGQSFTVSEGSKTMRVNGPDAQDPELISLEKPAAPVGFRSWAIRLDAWCTRQLNSTDWIGLDIIAGTCTGWALTGAVIYFLIVGAEALIDGRFTHILGGGR